MLKIIIILHLIQTKCIVKIVSFCAIINLVKHIAHVFKLLAQKYDMHKGRGRRHLGLRTYVLFSLMESPKNGIEIAYDLVRVLGWRPSPGSLYPLLMELEKEGLIEKTNDGKLKLTPHGIDYMSSIPFAINIRSITFMMEALLDRLEKRAEAEGLSEEEKKRLKDIAEKILKLTAT